MFLHNGRPYLQAVSENYDIFINNCAEPLPTLRGAVLLQDEDRLHIASQHCSFRDEILLVKFSRNTSLRPAEGRQFFYSPLQPHPFYSTVRSVSVSSPHFGTDNGTGGRYPPFRGPNPPIRLFTTPRLAPSASIAHQAAHGRYRGRLPPAGGPSLLAALFYGNIVAFTRLFHDNRHLSTLPSNRRRNGTKLSGSLAARFGADFS
ncbi:unnamed protein product [Tilletia controversa]|nr:unnamed protein product [Tilletia controversa]